MLQEIEAVLFLAGVISLLAVLAQKWNFPFSVLLVLAGLAIGFTPGLPHVEVEPDAVFLLILPPLLFSAAIMFPWRELRANLRPILGLAVGLVLATMVAVAGAAWWFIPGMTLAAGFVLGAIVSPPDAVAANSILHRLSVPRRVGTILEGESLVNDASGLVAWKFAVAALVTGTFSLREATGQFFLIAAGGTAIGLVMAWIIAAILKRVGEPVVELTLFLMTPYLVFVLAEIAGVSGVLAAVSAGMVIGHRSDEIFSSRARLDSAPVWGFFQHLLNSIVFILIGLQFPAIMEGLGPVPWPDLLLYLAIITAVVVAVRFGWFFLLDRLLHRWTRRRRTPREDPAPRGELIVMSWCGMRGVVSLAAALAVPELMADGTPVPQRDLILFLTYGVIFFTLLVPSVTLPALVRRLGLTGGAAPQGLELAVRAAVMRHGRAAVDRILDRVGAEPTLPFADFLREHFETRIRHYERPWPRDQPRQLDNRTVRRIVAGVTDELRTYLREASARGEIDEHLRAKIRRELDDEEIRIIQFFGG
jgi:Na+/H+ antiporter